MRSDDRARGYLVLHLTFGGSIEGRCFIHILVAASLATFIPFAALADETTPPADAMKRSAIVSALEMRVGDDLAYIDEVEGDDDGYWEV